MIINRAVFFQMMFLFFLPVYSLAQENDEPSSSRRIPKEERAVNNFDLSVNKVNYVHSRFPQLSGEGLGASVKEQRMDSTDIDFRDRYIPSTIGAPLVNTHATTMATIIAGAGNSFYTGTGVARGAGLSSSSFFNLFPDAALYFQTDFLTVQNHSYGLEIENFYGAEAAAYDRQLNDYPELVHVFSAGNMGESSSSQGPYTGVAGFANLTGTMKMAKNILTVGAVDSFFQKEIRSSSGPAYDGRIKPELVAFGQDGSSGAAAITSGLALLLQQAYRDRHNGALPSGGLVRAILLNSAEDLGRPGPDFSYGYGNVDAPAAIRTMVENRFFQASIKEGEQLDFPITLPDNALNLRITLAWIDPPATAGTASALVNDLDMSLTPPSDLDEDWLPWVLNHSPHIDSLTLPAKRGVDHLNNQEQITLIEPLPGHYTIQVNGYHIPDGTQEFFLAYEWDTTDHFEWMFPTRIDNLRPGEKLPLRWESTLADLTGKIEYRLIGTDNWTLIDEQADLSQAYLEWIAPDTLALAQLRLITATSMLLSDTFTISRPLNMDVAFNCEDDLLLFWDGQEGASAYQLFSLLSDKLEPVLNLQDTFVLLEKQEYPAEYFAVAPLISSNTTGSLSTTLNVAFQNAGCFIKSFSATLLDNEVHLDLILGSLYGVEKVWFEKRLGEAYVLLDTRPVNGSLIYRYTDTDLLYANNEYRAGVELTDGTRLYSDESSVFFLAESNYILFPNPVYVGEEIVVFSKEIGGEYLYLYDALGRLVLKYDLLSVSETLETNNLTSGIYFYQILLGKEKRASGKIMVR